MKQWWFIILLIISFPLKADNIFVEAESFDCRGGWVLDNQSMGQMGSPYLLAHGLGVPVENASTVIRVENGGKYRVWVRTRDLNPAKRNVALCKNDTCKNIQKRRV